MKLKIIEKLIIMLLDCVLIFFAFVGAYYLRLGTFFHSQFIFSEYIKMGVLMIPIWIFFLGYQGRYSLLESSLYQEFKKIIVSSLLASLLFPMMFYFSNEQFFSRGIPFILCVLTTIFLFFLSFFERKIFQYYVQKNKFLSRMLIVGANKSAEHIIQNLLKNFSYHKPVAILSPYGSKRKEICGIQILGKLDALEKVFISENINEIFLCEGIEHSENLASFCRNKGITLRTSFETLGLSHQRTQAEVIEGITFLSIHQSPLFGWGQFYKRLFDIFIAGIGIIIFSPYFLLNKKFITTVKIKNGIEESQTFNGYIFCKKINNVNTYYGRNIALLLNVLKKDMSIIGPQNLTIAEYNTIFKGKKEQSAVRFIFRPGLFSNFYFKKFSPEKILRLEILYIKNWTFWNDIKIFFTKIF